MARLDVLALTLLGIGFTIASCVGEDQSVGATAGQVGAACLPNGTCNVGLACSSGTCVVSAEGGTPAVTPPGTSDLDAGDAGVTDGSDAGDTGDGGCNGSGPIPFDVVLEPSSVVPPQMPKDGAGGGGQLIFEPATNKLCGYINYNLSGVTESHLFSGSAGTNGTSLFDLGTGTSATITLSLSMPENAEAALCASGYYVDVHYGTSSIRGQLTFDPTRSRQPCP